MKTFWALPLLILGLATPAAADGKHGLLVVELFTSQGCSSCPPADALLSELAERGDVLPLSFHVDYWDYIGWKDPYASPENTLRQRDYARTFNLSYVYTPQMVIDGVVQTAGTDRATVGAALRRGMAQARPVSVLTLKREAGGSVTLALPAQDENLGDCDLWRVVYDREHVTSVARGENRGRTITNRNVVRRMERLVPWSGQADTRALAGPGGPGEGLAVLAQSRSTGRIVAAGYLPPLTSP